MDPIIAAMLTLLISVCGFLISQWVRNVRETLNKHELRHAESESRHGHHEVRHATIVAQQESLTEKVDMIHKDVRILIGYANGSSSRGTGKP